jgi:tRNA pseudouridine55 synthase
MTVGRKRRGKPIHGWMVIDKPGTMSSNAVVGAVRRITGAAKVGHGGTLDPLATGLLPIALGEATKTVSYAMDGTKVYRFSIRWGQQRTTDDTEGDVTKTSDVRPNEATIRAALKNFIGMIEQVPPIYSAIKVNGQRAYALARANKRVELKPRRIRIDKFELVSMSDSNHSEFEVVSGKGAYMRGLARDLSLAVGTVGHIATLRRIRVGPFTEDHSISLEKLESLGHTAALVDFLLPVQTALADIPALAITETEARRIRQGQAIAVLPVVSRSPSAKVAQGSLVCAMADGKPVALAIITGGEIRPQRVLNL